jgi:hypothetical protein
MFVYDTSVRNSFNYICDYVASSQLMRLSKGTSDMPAMIVGRQTGDLFPRTVTQEQGMILAERIGCTFAEVDEADSQAVDELFCQMVKSKREYDRLRKAKAQNEQSPARTRALKRMQRQSMDITTLFGLRTGKPLEAIRED